MENKYLVKIAEQYTEQDVRRVNRNKAIVGAIGGTAGLLAGGYLTGNSNHMLDKTLSWGIGALAGRALGRKIAYSQQMSDMGLKKEPTRSSQSNRESHAAGVNAASKPVNKIGVGVPTAATTALGAALGSDIFKSEVKYGLNPEVGRMLKGLSGNALKNKIRTETFKAGIKGGATGLAIGGSIAYVANKHHQFRKGKKDYDTQRTLAHLNNPESKL